MSRRESQPATAGCSARRASGMPSCSACIEVGIILLQAAGIKKVGHLHESGFRVDDAGGGCHATAWQLGLLVLLIAWLAARTNRVAA